MKHLQHLFNCKKCKRNNPFIMLSLCYGASCCVNVGQKIIFGSGNRLIIEPSKCHFYYTGKIKLKEKKVSDK